MPTTRRNWIGTCAASAAFIGATQPARAAQWNLRVATVAPPGTSFHKHFESLAAEWKKAPGGGVAMNIYPGTQGGEETIVQRMRLRQLQGGMLSAAGLGKVDEAVTALQLMPMAFRSWDEVDHVRGKLEPLLEKRFADAGYVVLFWADAGWVRFFSKKPLLRVGELRGMRIMATAGMPKAIELQKKYYNPVILEADKVLLGLKNGMIDAVPVPPFLANALQVATEAKHMLDMKWVPVVGAMVLDKKLWDSFPPATQTYLRDTAAVAGGRIREESRREDDAAIAAMQQKQGLQVTTMDEAVMAEWLAEVERTKPALRGQIVPADMFDLVLASLKEFRSR
jgi:TRAP-type C4-dicarboxylate transport system substrate-binding protein